MTSTSWRPVPQPVAVEGLPRRVSVYEVGPRDGLQSEPEVLPAELKAELCRRLLTTGITSLETTSFVSPRWVPQLADAEQVLALLTPPAGVRTVALVMNSRGLDRALAAGVHEIAVVASATESFAKANFNATMDDALATAGAVATAAVSAGLRVRGYLSMSFGDPWEGPVAHDRVAEFAASLYAAGSSTVALGDTIGTGTPGHVERIVQLVTDAGVPRELIALHLHDTYGQALGNVQAGLRSGILEFDSSVGGLGRCPYARGATGNLATEDLVWMLHGLGIETGIDLDALVAVSQWVSRQLGKPLNSRVTTALTAAATE